MKKTAKDTKKKYLNPDSALHALHSIKHVIFFLAGVALVYSFLWMPIQAKNDRLTCDAEARQFAQQVSAQVAEQNENLEEGQEPATVNEIGLYETQYALCVRSKGL
tara:strand:- start:486 stop:803 length:318 start_codon:yes stop_codon:yes gene_type:complete